MAEVLPINPDVLHEELEAVEKLIVKWKGRVSQGIAGIDMPAANAEEKIEAFIREFSGELLYVSNKLAAMASIVSER